MRVAVVGTGIMGSGIARSLCRSGHDVTAWNRTKSRAERLQDDGIAVTGTVAAAVADADAALTILFDTSATLGMCDELVGALRPDAVWIQSATLGPDGVHQVAERAGRELVDAPVLGTKKPAAEGKLVVLASGEPSLLERSKPVFDAIGARTVVVSDRIGDASALKLVCNAWIGVITAGTAQSLAFAQRLGLDPRLFLDTIAGTPTDSVYAQARRAGKPPVATGPHRCGVIRISDLPCARIAAALSSHRATARWTPTGQSARWADAAPRWSRSCATGRAVADPVARRGAPDRVAARHQSRRTACPTAHARCARRTP